MSDKEMAVIQSRRDKVIKIVKEIVFVRLHLLKHLNYIETERNE